MNSLPWELWIWLLCLLPGSTECSLTVNDLAGCGFGEEHEDRAPDEESPLDEEKQGDKTKSKNDKRLCACDTARCKSVVLRKHLP